MGYPQQLVAGRCMIRQRVLRDSRGQSVGFRMGRSRGRCTVRKGSGLHTRYVVGHQLCVYVYREGLDSPGFSTRKTRFAQRVRRSFSARPPFPMARPTRLFRPVRRYGYAYGQNTSRLWNLYTKNGYMPPMIFSALAECSQTRVPIVVKSLTMMGRDAIIYCVYK